MRAVCCNGSRLRWCGSHGCRGGSPPNGRWGSWASGTSGRWWPNMPPRGDSRVLCCDPPREAREQLGFLPLEAVAREADVLTLHVPLDDSTRHMAGRDLLGLLRPDAVLINTSRGEVADTAALLAGGHPCMLDVWENEPHLDRTLLAGVWAATPHVAGYSEQGKANAAAMSVGPSHGGSGCRSWGGIRRRSHPPHPVPFRGRSYAPRSTIIATSKPKPAGSKRIPKISSRCATNTATGKSIFNPVKNGDLLALRVLRLVSDGRKRSDPVLRGGDCGAREFTSGPPLAEASARATPCVAIAFGQSASHRRKPGGRP